MFKRKKEGGGVRFPVAVGVIGALMAAAVMSMLAAGFLYDGRLSASQLSILGPAATLVAVLIGTLLARAAGKEKKRCVLITACILLALRVAAGAVGGDLLSFQTALGAAAAAVGALPAYRLSGRRNQGGRAAAKRRRWAR